MTLAFLLALPWLLLFTAFFAVVRPPRELPRGMAGGRSSAGEEPPPGGRGTGPPPVPLVSVVIPARNEAHNVERVLATLTASRYPRFEVVVVDDQSADGTGALARATARGRAERLEVVTGLPLPDGWLGKPWSCTQGAREARGELLLFTDADTVHGPELLSRAVAALEEDRADVVTVLGRQIMGSFWERLVQPQIFLMLLSRFRDPRRPLPPARWRDAIANGQYLLFRRSVYDAVGGHRAVRHEVAEDLRLAQILVKDGWRLSLRGAEDAFSTRMYRSLGELVGGWSKNAAIGARQSAPRWLRPVLLPGAVVAWCALWIAPPVALAAALAGVGGAPLLLWASLVVAPSVLFWGALTARMGSAFRYGLLYPLGAGVAAWILLRSWARGSRVEWKGREYRVRVEE